MNSNSVPFLRQPKDAMREGLGTFKFENSQGHPVEAIEKNYAKTQEQTRKQMMARVYGSHLPMKLQMEEKILGQFQRFPGLRSSFAGLEALSGRDMEIEFGDYLNDPRYSEEQVDGLVKMERKFGDLPGDRMS